MRYGAPPQVFPAIQRNGNELKQAAAAVIEQTDQEDLRTMANAYASTLDVEIKKAGRCAVWFALPCMAMLFARSRRLGALDRHSSHPSL